MTATSASTQEDRRRADDVGCDEPADRDVHDRVGHLDGGLVALDEAVDPAADRLAERRDAGGALSRTRRRGRHPRVAGPTRAAGCRRAPLRRSAVDRYSSLTLASVPAPTTSSFAMPEQSRDHRPREVDALHAVERRAALRAEQDAASHLDVVSGDAERVEPPRQVEDPDEHEQDAEHDQDRDEVQVVGDDEVDRVAGALPLLELLGRDVGRERRDEEVEQPIAQVRDDDAEDDEQEQPAAQQRGQRVKPVPFAVAERRAHQVLRRRRRASAAGTRRRARIRRHGPAEGADRS